jgi:hypothetical protein
MLGTGELLDLWFVGASGSQRHGHRQKRNKTQRHEEKSPASSNCFRISDCFGSIGECQ